MPLRLILCRPPPAHRPGPGPRRLSGHEAAQDGDGRGRPEAPPPPLTVDVLVAAHSLPAGTLMKDEDFTKRAVPSADVPKGALTEQPGGPRRPARRACCAITSTPATS